MLTIAYIPEKNRWAFEFEKMVYGRLTLLVLRLWFIEVIVGTGSMREIHWEAIKAIHWIEREPVNAKLYSSLFGITVSQDILGYAVNISEGEFKVKPKTVRSVK